MDILETSSGTLVQTFIIPTIRKFSPQPILNNIFYYFNPFSYRSTKDVVNIQFFYSCSNLLCTVKVSSVSLPYIVISSIAWLYQLCVLGFGSHRVQFQGYSQGYKHKYQSSFFRSQLFQIMQRSGYVGVCIESISIMCSFQSAQVKMQRQCYLPLGQTAIKNFRF